MAPPHAIILMKQNFTYYEKFREPGFGYAAMMSHKLSLLAPKGRQISYRWGAWGLIALAESVVATRMIRISDV